MYHIMLRGINKEEIFRDILDYEKFLKILKLAKEKYEYQLYAYCLMNNHVHLLIHVLQNNISNLLQSVGISYALYLNKKYERVGHVFQNRYNSKCVESQSYLLNVIRYIHKNPEHAKICLTENYRWSSYAEYMSQPYLADTENILKMFDKNIIQSKRKFKKFHLIDANDYEYVLEYEFLYKLSDEQVKKIIEEKFHISNVQEISQYNVEIRNDYIRQLKKMKGISKTQLSRILCLNRKIIERA